MRLILIDSDTGFIWSDTADLVGFDGSEPSSDTAMVQAAQLTDIANGEHGLTYTTHSPYSQASGHYYLVYRADLNGAGAVAVVRDGQDQKMIEAVERDCELIGRVTWEEPSGFAE